MKLIKFGHDVLAALSLVTVFAVCDFAITPLMFAVNSPRLPGAVLSLAIFGVIAAQACLLSICSTIGPGTLIYRRTVESAVGVLWLCAVAAGYVAVITLNLMPHYFLTLADVWIVMFAPSIYLGIQFPLWIMGGFFHWRIESYKPNPNSGPVRSLTLADLLIAIAAVAVALGCARTGFYLTREGDAWLALGILVVGAAGVSIASSLPTAVLILGFDWIGLGLGILGAYAITALIVTCLIAAQFVGARSVEVLYWVPLFVGFVLALAGPLCLARALGYRLKWARGKRQTLST